MGERVDQISLDLVEGFLFKNLILGFLKWFTRFDDCVLKIHIDKEVEKIDEEDAKVRKNIRNSKTIFHFVL